MSLFFFQLQISQKLYLENGPSQQSMNAPKPMYNNIIIPPADINKHFIQITN